MVDHQSGEGASLVLLSVHHEVLVGAQLPVDRVPPGEGWRRLAPALDLPEGGPVDPDGLGAGLTLVNGRGN